MTIIFDYRDFVDPESDKKPLEDLKLYDFNFDMEKNFRAFAAAHEVYYTDGVFRVYFKHMKHTFLNIQKVSI